MAGSSRFTRGLGFLASLKAKVLSIGTSDVEEQFNVANVSLSAANLIAMNGAPVSILPAPGATKVILVDSIVFKMVTTATAFTGGGAVSFVYNGGATSAITGTIPAAVVTAGAGTSYTAMGPAAAASGTTLLANKGIDITNATAAFATGTGTAVVHIKYRIVTLP